MLTGYEQIYKNLLPQLLSCDLKEAAERLGLNYCLEGTIELTFLGRQYKITKHGVELLDESQADYLIFCVLLYYTFSRGSGEPKYSFAPLFRLSGLHEGQNTHTKSLTNKQLTNAFGADYEAFKKAAVNVGGKLSDEKNSQCHSWIFTLFPKIVAKIDFYEADEEFPAEVQLFLDEITTRFMDFECIAFLAGCLVKELTNHTDIAPSHSELNNLSHCGFIQKML